MLHVEKGIKISCILSEIGYLFCVIYIYTLDFTYRLESPINTCPSCTQFRQPHREGLARPIVQSSSVYRDHLPMTDGPHSLAPFIGGYCKSISSSLIKFY